MEIFKDSHFHIPLAVTWVIKMSPSCLHILVHIAQVLLDPLSQTLAGLANILLTTPSHPTADGIAYVAGVAVYLSFQVNNIAGGSGLEGLSRLDVGADRTSLSTLLHSRSHSS